MFGRHLFFLILTVLILLDAADADIKRQCRRESKVSWEALRRMKAGDFEQKDPKLKCYLRCFMTQHGILNSNGEIDVQRALRHIPRSLQEASKNLLNKCQSVPGSDPCDKAFQIAKCYVKYQPEILNSGSFI